MSSVHPSSAYERSGVNISLGDLFNSYCGEICRRSYDNSRFVRVHDFSGGHFRGRRGYEMINLPRGTLHTAGGDGIGTKTIIIDAAGQHFHSATNLLAMLGGDFTRDGCMGLIVVNHLDVKTLGKDPGSPTFVAVKKLITGLGNSAKEQKLVVLTGETAELAHCVTSENPNATLAYNWGAVMIGVMHPDKLIKGDAMKPGDRVIALRDVTRSNGISLLRRGLRHRYGLEWFTNESAEARASIIEAASPSALYDRFLVHLNGWTAEDFQVVIRVHGIAHLSGGGIPSKFGDDLLFPRRLSAKLRTLWDPPKVMRQCAADLEVSEEEAYEVWGCGQGALVVLSDEDTAEFIRIAEHFGISACVAGEICATPSGAEPSIQIVSGFSGDLITVNPKKK